MSMLRLAFVGMVSALALTLGAGQRIALAETDETRASSADSAEDGVAKTTSEAASEGRSGAASKPRKKRGAQDLRRHARLSGGFVAEEQLRQSALARPSGRLHVIFPGVRDEVDVNIYNEDGSYNLDAIEQLSHVLRCRRTEAEKPMAPQLLMLLSHVEDHFGDKPIEIVSGYRNQRKKTSNHYKGTATDIRIVGVAPKKVREFAETLDRGGMGIGLYPRGGFVHIDVRHSPSYRWIDYSPPGSNAAEKRPPVGWKKKKLQS